MSETMIRKNHMDVLWHEYTDKEGQNSLLYKQALRKKPQLSAVLALCFYPAELVRGVCAVL